MKVFKSEDGQVIIDHCEVAATFFQRAKGLLGRAQLKNNQGMLITPCNSVHTFFMKFPIDIIFLDKKNTILELVSDLRPWRLSKIIFSAHSILELPAKKISECSLKKGTQLQFSERFSYGS